MDLQNSSYNSFKQSSKSRNTKDISMRRNSRNEASLESDERIPRWIPRKVIPKREQNGRRGRLPYTFLQFPSRTSRRIQLTRMASEMIQTALVLLLV
ncbi:hypothetical protein CRE_21005 [Caenorhabditis remanei]|uniref:Uncharacterized protein n=1 Tax=Caenorhabditis remanei TaxID=31234 RepID=E3NKG8_CAERE|nr:hypothetical protein CRE_21005 [Caenorhabditis remanei]